MKTEEHHDSDNEYLETESSPEPEYVDELFPEEEDTELESWNDLDVLEEDDNSKTENDIDEEEDFGENEVPPKKQEEEPGLSDSRDSPEPTPSKNVRVSSLPEHGRPTKRIIRSSNSRNPRQSPRPDKRVGMAPWPLKAVFPRDLTPRDKKPLKKDKTIPSRRPDPEEEKVIINFSPEEARPEEPVEGEVGEKDKTRFNIGLPTLDQLGVQVPLDEPLPSQSSGKISRPPSQPVPETDPQIQEAPESRQPRDEKPSLELAKVIEANSPLPEFSIILGICKDSLPLVLELHDPTPGSILLIGEEADGNRAHLESILSSTLLLNNSKQVQLDLITPDPQAFQDISNSAHCKHVLHPGQLETYDLLGEYFSLVEKRQRKKKRDHRPVKILGIDRLDSLLAGLSPDSLAYLRWLFRRGPFAGVWTVATLEVNHIAKLQEKKTLRTFGLCIVGSVQNRDLANQLSGVPKKEIATMVQDGEACVKLGDDVIQFNVPLPSNP